MCSSDLNPDENFGPLEPISTYGASKLACEALISAYCHMFGLAACAFRFANVVGPRQTHGVVYDFVRKLRAEPSRLEVLGNGTQRKSYIWVSDVIDAMRIAAPTSSEEFEVFNVGTRDSITVHRIAEIVSELMAPPVPMLVFESQASGWKGDVPVVAFDDSKIRARGWCHTHSAEEAIVASAKCNIAETIDTAHDR